MYLPFAYASAVKHPQQRFVWRSVVQEDGMFWLLATVFLAPQPLWHAVATALFLVSFWCIYEQGYIENDQVAVQFEGAMGRVPDGFADHRPAFWLPWTWAVLLGAAGAGVLAWQGGALPALAPWLSQTLIWVGFLAATRLIFAFYNRLSPASRPVFYVLLQVCRNFGVLAFAAANLVGVLILAAHTLARGLPYYVYRFASRVQRRSPDWPELPVFLIRLLTFVFLVAAIAVGTRDLGIVLQLQTWVILAWCVYRSRKESLAALRGLERLPRTSDRAP